MEQDRLRKVVFPWLVSVRGFCRRPKSSPRKCCRCWIEPLIQYAVDEAVDAGADTLIFVTNRYKHAIADYFDHGLRARKQARTAPVRTSCSHWCESTLPGIVRCVFVTQAEALGLGHAVLCAKPVIGDEPFGVILPDDLIWNVAAGKPGALRQMAEFGTARVSRRRSPSRKFRTTDRQIRHRRCDALPGRVARVIRHMVEKPKPEDRAVEPRYCRPLCTAGAHLRSAGENHARRRRRNPVDRCDRGAARANRSSPIVSKARVSTAATSSA